MFKEERNASQFHWSMIGNIHEGRPNLGGLVTVDIYRLMQFTLRDAMITEIGVQATDALFYKAGKKAGEEFCRNVIGHCSNFNEFVEKTQKNLKELGIGILRIEKADFEKNTFVMTVAEDLDCSGLPVTDEEICVYDEGFIAGLLKAHTGNEFTVEEIDCWCSGDRVCRFDVRLTGEDGE